LNATKRTNEQVDGLERRIRNMKSEREIENFETNNANREEKKRYMQQNRESLEQSEEQRSKVYEAVNAKTHQEINDITKRNNEILDRQNKHYQGRIGELSDKYNESIENQVNSLEIENKEDKKAGDMQRKKLAHVLTKEKNELENYYQSMIDEGNRLHKEDLDELRANLTNQKKESIRLLEQRIRDLDAKYANKLNVQSEKYEAEILDLKEAHKIENKSTVEQYSKRINELEKNQKFATDTSKIQAESRESQLKESYERQMETLRSKQEEERIRMAMKRS